jgi:spermidine synthase
MVIAKMAPYKGVDSMELEPDVTRAVGASSVYVVIALSGFTALAAEVIWTRLLSLLFGATTYTFSLILAVFLFGLGIGSSVGSLLGKSLKQPKIALAWCQIGLCAAMAWTAWVLTQSLPYWPVNPSISPSAWFQFQLDFVRCLFAILPGALLWGASFPLALASVASKEDDPAK